MSRGIILQLALFLLFFQFCEAQRAVDTQHFSSDDELDKYEKYLRSELERIQNEKKLTRLRRSIQSLVPEKIDRNTSFIARILPLQTIESSNVSIPNETTVQAVENASTTLAFSSTEDENTTTTTPLLISSPTVTSTAVSSTTTTTSSPSVIQTSTSASSTVKLSTSTANDLPSSTTSPPPISAENAATTLPPSSTTSISSTATSISHNADEESLVSSSTASGLPAFVADAQAAIRFRSSVIANATSALSHECQKYTQPELVAELKQKGTYNPDLMAWDALGILRFIDKAIHDQYQKETTNPRQLEEIVEKNTNSLKRLLSELNVTCSVTDVSVRARLRELSLKQLRRSIISPSLRRTKRMNNENVLMALVNATLSNEHRVKDHETGSGKQRLIGESHSVPFGCDKRGSEEDGYLRLCGACQTIRHLPDNFFPPFINEITCDTDKACLYFYDYPHGKCRQRHMNFAVLRNVGTKECQVWKKYNLNVRVSCECFVDEMSFFSKYV